MTAEHKKSKEIVMDDLRIDMTETSEAGATESQGQECQGQECRAANAEVGQAQDCPAEGAAGEGIQDKETGEEGGKVSVGMATIPMSLIQEMVGRRGPRKPACSPMEEADRLLRAYADYAQPNVFTAGQLVAPKSMGREVEDCGPFGVVLAVDAVPGPEDAPNETLRIGRFSDDGFRVAAYDPLRFQPYVPVASQPDLSGNEAGA